MGGAERLSTKKNSDPSVNLEVIKYLIQSVDLSSFFITDFLGMLGELHLLFDKLLAST